MEHDHITQVVIGCAFRIHNEMGPGLVESIYETMMAQAIREERFEVETQKYVRLVVAGRTFPKAFRVDLLVGKKVVVELKSAAAITPVDVKQPLSYLKLLNPRVGLILNFGRESLQIKRLLNGY